MLVDLKPLCVAYAERKQEIQQRLKEFEQAFDEGDARIFEELVFCILAANTSSKMSSKCVEALRPILLHGTAAEMKRKLVGIYRFINLRPAYIHWTRTYLEAEHGFALKALLRSFTDSYELRDYLALNPNIKGIGYKEASHFLRNVGFKGYCILDKHILNQLHAFGVLDKVERPANGKRYLAIEAKMKQFAEKLEMDVDELDLLFWSMKTGEVLK